MRLDPDLRAYLDEQVASGAKRVNELSVAEARDVMARAAPLVFGPAESVASIYDRTIPGLGGTIPVRVYNPVPGPQLPMLVYLHGGGWVHGSLETHDGLCRSLANRARCVVVAVDYRLAPEHRFPAAIEDAWAAVTWVRRHAHEIGGDPDLMAVGGDSAGGNLAAVVALRARDAGEPRLALQLLVYPALDYNPGTPSWDRNGTGYVLTRKMLDWYWDHYLPVVAARQDPEASPLRARDVSGVAPARVLTCEYDPLLDEGRAFADRLTASGVPVVYRCYGGLSHGVFRMPGAVPRAWEMIDDSASALRSAFSSRETR